MVYTTLSGQPQGVYVAGPHTTSGTGPTGTTFGATDGGTFNFNATTGVMTYVPPPTPTGGFSPPPSSSAAAHLQFSASTIGTSIFLTWGRARLPGQIIWAAGIDPTNNVIDSSYLTFAAAYGEPIDSDQLVRPQKMWANGTLFYDYDQGGVISVANLSTTDQSALQACIDGMEVYSGTETQIACPTMQTYLGDGNVPAYKGLRYITFTDFPLAISNNGVPNVIVEWRPTVDTGLLDVADAMVALITHVNLRSELKPIFGTPVVEGIADFCYGLTVINQGSLLDHFSAHRNIYNFQIVESDPIKIVRRAVGAGLVIDFQVAEEDCIGNESSPAVVFNRANPTDFPIGVNLSYTDPDNAYDVKVAPATFDGSPPGDGNTGSSAVLSAQSDYIVDATSARTLAYSMLFDLRSFSGRASFEFDDPRPQVSDVIEVTSTEGDIYIVLVNGQTYTKTSSNHVDAMILLTEAGPDVDGDGGRDGGSVKYYWPEMFSGNEVGALAVSADRIYTAWWRFSGGNRIAMNTLVAPRRRPPSTYYREWTNFNFDEDLGIASGAPPGTAMTVGAWEILLDDTYAYYLYAGGTLITRVPLNGTMAAHEELAIPGGLTPFGGTYGDPPRYNGDAQMFEYLQFGQIVAGKLYMIAYAFNWDGGADRQLIIVVDLTTFDVADVEYFDIPEPPAGMAISNGTFLFCGNGTIRYSLLSDLVTWGTLATTGGWFPEAGVACGNYAYFSESLHNLGVTPAHLRGVFVDCTSFPPTKTEVLITADPNITSGQPGGVPWSDGTHVYFMTNVSWLFWSSGATWDENHPYLAKWDPVTATPVGGTFLNVFPPWNINDLFFERGAYANGKHYICASGFVANGAILIVEGDFSSATMYPQKAVTIANDDFADAIEIAAGDTVTSNNTGWATDEASEPPYPGATRPGWDTLYQNLHSVWYKFTPVTSGDYTLSLYYGGIVYTGSDVASLTAIAQTPSNSLTWYALSGVEYHIRVIASEGWTITGDSGRAQFTRTTLSAVTVPSLDDDENFQMFM